MNTGEKIDYMIQCLQVAKAECEHLNEWNVRDWADERDAEMGKFQICIYGV